MNVVGASPEMLHFLDTSGMDMAVLEKQRASLNWWHDQNQDQDQVHLRQRQERCYDGSGCGSLSSVLIPASGVEDFQNLTATGWPELDKCEMPSMEFEPSGSAVSRTLTCPPAAAGKVEVKSRETMVSVQTTSTATRENSKKRKAKKEQKTKVAAKAESKEKRVKSSEEDEETKITEQNSTKSRETSADNNTSKQNPKASEVSKTDYIHVRARRGQATDSHSLAERARREKISERMKYLQSLVPGCNKITGKAGMLDEIINYVQSLQQQVEFLSMKLAALNPILDFNDDDPFAKQQVMPTIGMSPEMTNSPYLDQLGTDEQMVSCCLSVPENLMIDSATYTQQYQPSSTWDAALESLYNVSFEGGPSSNFLSQQYSGSIEASYQKMEIM